MELLCLEVITLRPNIIIYLYGYRKKERKGQDKSSLLFFAVQSNLTANEYYAIFQANDRLEDCNVELKLNS